MDTLRIAKLCHEANRKYCQLIGDNSQLSWEDAPEWQRESTIKGVEFHRKNPQAKPEDSHTSWLKEKEKQGWRYGEVKDPERKLHPCCVSYLELPVEQRMKDYIFICVCHAAFIE